MLQVGPLIYGMTHIYIQHKYTWTPQLPAVSCYDSIDKMDQYLGHEKRKLYHKEKLVRVSYFLHVAKTVIVVILGTFILVLFVEIIKYI